MTNLRLTYGNLLNYHNQIQKQIQSNTVCSFFNREKINQFYNNYKLRIDTAIRERGDLKAKYFIIDENGKFEFEEKDGKQFYKLKEGLTMEGFKAEEDIILNREVLM